MHAASNNQAVHLDKIIRLFRLGKVQYLTRNCKNKSFEKIHDDNYQLTITIFQHKKEFYIFHRVHLGKSLYWSNAWQ